MFWILRSASPLVILLEWQAQEDVRPYPGSNLPQRVPKLSGIYVVY